MAPVRRREVILDTAMSIISEEGYRGLSMREVARRCGMSAPGLMHYYPDMPTLLRALLERRDEIDGARLAAAIADQQDLRKLVDTIVDYRAEHPRGAQLFAMVQAEALDPAHPARAYFEGRHRRSEDLIRKHVPTPVPAELLSVLPAVLDGLLTHWLMDPEAFDLRRQWAIVADALFARYTA